MAMGLKILKWAMFLVAALFTAMALAEMRAIGLAAVAGGLWVSFTMLYLYDRHFNGGEDEAGSKK